MADESCGQALETEEVDRRTSHEGKHSRTDYTEVRRRATAVIYMRARRRSRTLVGPARLTVNPVAAATATTELIATRRLLCSMSH